MTLTLPFRPGDAYTSWLSDRGIGAASTASAVEVFYCDAFEKAATVLILANVSRDYSLPVVDMLKRLSAAVGPQTALVVSADATPEARAILAAQQNLSHILCLGDAWKNVLAKWSPSVDIVQGPEALEIMENATVKRDFWLSVKTKLSL